MFFSGAGKTTLCNVLNHRDMSGMKVEGDIRINGRHVGKGLARHVGYVQQFDSFIGTLKVKEHLAFQVSYRYVPFAADSLLITSINVVTVIKLGWLQIIQYAHIAITNKKSLVYFNCNEYLTVHFI